MTISSDLSASFKNKKGYQRLIKVMLGNWIHHLSGVCLESQGNFFCLLCSHYNQRTVCYTNPPISEVDYIYCGIMMLACLSADQITSK